MKCFYHPEREAVGTCRSCGKGVCTECAVEVEKALACKDRCEEDVNALVKLVDHHVEAMASEKRLLGSTGRSALYSALIYIVVGMLFIVWSRIILYDTFSSRHYPMILAIGICLTVFGILNIGRTVVMWLRVRKAHRDER